MVCLPGETFHSKCDSPPRTIVLVKKNNLEDEFVIGYTSRSWQALLDDETLLKEDNKQLRIPFQFKRKKRSILFLTQKKQFYVLSTIHLLLIMIWSLVNLVSDQYYH